MGDTRDEHPSPSRGQAARRRGSQKLKIDLHDDCRRSHDVFFADHGDVSVFCPIPTLGAAQRRHRISGVTHTADAADDDVRGPGKPVPAPDLFISCLAHYDVSFDAGRPGLPVRLFPPLYVRLPASRRSPAHLCISHAVQYTSYANSHGKHRVYAALPADPVYPPPT